MTDRWAWPTMGSVASLVVPGATESEGDAAMRRVRAWFDDVEAALSPYRPDSDLCRWRSGVARLEQCSPLLAGVIADVEPLPEVTQGGFHPFDRQGRFDPTGYVKGWAVERGLDLLRADGIADACLGVGGDQQMVGRSGFGRPWRVAVVDPADERRPVALVQSPGTGLWAVATSGDAQRGNHIWSVPGRVEAPVPAAARTGLRSVTVVGPRLSRADAYATAVWALAQQRSLDESWGWLADLGYEALAVDRVGRLRLTPGMAAHLVRAA